MYEVLDSRGRPIMKGEEVNSGTVTLSFGRCEQGVYLCHDRLHRRVKVCCTTLYRIECIVSYCDVTCHITLHRMSRRGRTLR